MLAGSWKTARMVAHLYAAGATAERGAVAKHFSPRRGGRQDRGAQRVPLPALDQEA